jgi:hypothetical protein
MPRRLALVVAIPWLAACDRNLEPFDPSEQPQQPDLARIFPAGAERAGQEAPPTLPPPPGRGAPPLAAEAAAGGDGPAIRGTIAVAEELAGRVREGGVLFLIARRAAAGPPLAVQRIASPRFPLEFSIGPADRMLPSVSFAGELQLSARLDGDGDALSREAGDLEGRAARAVAPGATGIVIVLDEILGEG